MAQIQFKDSGNVYDVAISQRGRGKKLYHCPECSTNRKNKKAKTLSWHNDTKSGYCHHCNAWCRLAGTYSDKAPVSYRPAEPAVPPVERSLEDCHQEVMRKYPLHKRTLSHTATQWLQSRGISRDTAQSMGVFSIMCGDKIEAIGFVYKYKGLEVNIKFRRLSEKSFFFAIKDAPKIAYNAPAIGQSNSLIVVEGEMDVLAVAEVGLPSAVSPPCGAGGSQQEWTLRHQQELATIDRFVLATDHDVKGFELRDTLMELWGPERCDVVKFDAVKDANELLLTAGADALREAVLRARKQEPVCPFLTDIRQRKEEFLNYFRYGGMVGKETDFEPLDSIVRWRTGALALVTGIPGHGKSGFLDFVMMLLNRKHNWKAAVYSPENNPLEHHIGKLVSLMTGCGFSPDCMSEAECLQAYDEVADSYSFILPDLCKLDDIIAAITWLVKHRGVKMVSIDPFNVLEFAHVPGMPETEQINDALKKLHRLAQELDILIFVVAHPRKIEVRKMNKLDLPVHRIPTLYDVMGSSHFYNHVDYGIIVYRDYDTKGGYGQSVKIIFEKIRWCELGTPGSCTVEFDISTNRYQAEGCDDLENVSWLKALPETK